MEVRSHLRVHGKGSKTGYILLHAGAQALLNDYLDEACHATDITNVQECLGHANIATTRIYDRRRSKVED